MTPATARQLEAPVPDSPALRPVDSPPAEAPAGGMLALGLAGMCAFLNLYPTQPLLPLLEKVFGVPKAQAVLTVSASTLAVALAAPFMGAISDRLGRRRVIIASLFGLAIPTLLAATAGSIRSLIAWRFLQGLMVPGVYAVSIAYAGSRWPASSVGRAMASIVTGNVVGGFLGRALSGIVADQAGWRASFLAIGALTLVGAAAICRLLPAEGAPAPVRHLGARVHLGRLLDSRLFAIFAVGFNVLFMQVAAFTYVTFHLAEPPFRLGTAAMSSIFAVYLIGAVVTPFAGRWIGRIGARRVLLLALGGGTLGALLTLLPLLVAVVLGLALLATAAFVGQSAATSHLSAMVAPEVRSIASGVYLSSYYIGGAVGGVLPAMAWHLGGWSACVALILAFELMTLGLAARYFTRMSGSKPVARDWPPASPSRCA